MTDIVTQSLGHAPEYKQSLVERRKQYEDWLTSGRKAPRPVVPVYTGIAHSRVDDVDTGGTATPPEVFTLNELPPGAIVRTDEGETDVANASEDVRLKLAGALVDKMATADPETATRMANAGNALLAPLKVRADDAKADDTGTNLKNRVLGDEDKDKKDDTAPTLQGIMDAIGAIGARLDKIEGKGKDGEHNLNEPRGRKAADDDGLRDDSFKVRTKLENIDNETHNWKNQDAFAAFQRRADSVSQLFGKSAPPPMTGETLGAYKRRSVIEWQKFSPAFKHSDLRVLQAADSVAFNTAIEDILSRADAEGRNPTAIPRGYLAERSETRNGHTYTRFYGKPSVWLDQFMPRGRRVRSINSNPGSALYQRA